MYSIDIKERVDKTFVKISKKNPKQMEMIYKKLEEIAQNPQHYKNLRAPLNHLKRVHIDNNFILTFSVDENRKTIILEDFDHHDKIYKN